MVNSKKKGNAWENKIATQVRNHFVPDKYDRKTAHSLVHRTPMSGGHVERGDLIIKPPIWQQFPWFIECRNRESWSWKNIMEKGENSVIIKWFLEDAVEKCHPYDNDAQYPRNPLLLFTKNHQKVYFCAWAVSLKDVVNINEFDAAAVFKPCVKVYNPKFPNGDYSMELAVIGSFDTLLDLHYVVPEEVEEDIDKYLGINDVFGDGS